MQFLWKSQVETEELEKASSAVVLITFALLAVGLIAAASGAPPGMTFQNIATHGIRIGFGIAALLFFYRVDLEKVRRAGPYFLAICYCLLIVVLLPGIGHSANNAQRWIRLGPLTVQPSEIMKIALVLYLADYAAKKHHDLEDFRKGFVPALGVMLAVSGIVFLEPDFGTAVYLLFVSGAILVAGGARVNHFVYTGLLGLPVIVMFAWNKFEHVRGRFHALASGGGYQVRRGLEALGSGGLFGQGLGNGMVKLGYVPEGRNDFVAALIGEEWGWLGMLCLILLFAGFLYYGLRIIYGSSDRFGALVAFGVIFAIVLQAGVNLAVVAAIAPPKGIALPFVSAGGSSMVMMCAGIGLVANVAKRELASRKKQGEQLTTLPGNTTSFSPVEGLV